jgi:hypothetical protein
MTPNGKNGALRLIIYVALGAAMVGSIGWGVGRGDVEGLADRVIALEKEQVRIATKLESVEAILIRMDAKLDKLADKLNEE